MHTFSTVTYLKHQPMPLIGSSLEKKEKRFLHCVYQSQNMGDSALFIVQVSAQDSAQYTTQDSAETN